MVHLNSCCCGCSLKTGSLITSIWELLFSIFMLGVGIWGLSEAAEWAKYPDMEVHIYALTTTMIVLLISGIISGFFAGLLLIGTVKKVPSLVNAWNVFAIVWVVLSCIGVFISFVNGAPKNGISIALVVLKIYCIVVVRSFLHDLASPSDPAQPPAYTSVGYIPAKGEVV